MQKHRKECLIRIIEFENGIVFASEPSTNVELLPFATRDGASKWLWLAGQNQRGVCNLYTGFLEF